MFANNVCLEKKNIIKEILIVEENLTFVGNYLTVIGFNQFKC